MPQHLGDLIEAAVDLIDAGAIDDVLEALAKGDLKPSSGPTVVARIASGRISAQDALTRLLTTWREKHEDLDAGRMVLVLSAAQTAIEIERGRSPETEIVWTGPAVKGSHLRATRQVVQDIVAGAKEELLIVGYWLAGREDQEGIVADVVTLMADAVERGVEVTMALDRSEKAYGEDNRQTLISLWPKGTSLPRLYTWQTPEDETHLKLHAKVMVADRHDSLITSANLTMHALERNIEMGVRVIGEPSHRIAEHFDLMISRGTLEPYED